MNFIFAFLSELYGKDLVGKFRFWTSLYDKVCITLTVWPIEL